MANTPSAKKRILQTAKRTAVNAARKSRIRTFVRKVEEAIRGGDAEAARTALRDAQPEIMRGAARGVLHANTASRKMARLAHRVKVMQSV
jgi:small subunit ribosomal protein S20